MSDWFATLAWLKSKDMLRDTDSQIHSDYRWLYSPLIQRPAHIHHCPALTRSLSVSLSQFLSLCLGCEWYTERGGAEWGMTLCHAIHPSALLLSTREMDESKERKRKGENAREQRRYGERHRVCVFNPTYLLFFFITVRSMPKLQSTGWTLVIYISQKVKRSTHQPTWSSPKSSSPRPGVRHA